MDRIDLRAVWLGIFLAIATIFTVYMATHAHHSRLPDRARCQGPVATEPAYCFR